jgi:hypothetical protein
VDAIRDLLAAHNAAPYPPDLPGGAEVEGVSLVMLDADVAGAAAAYLGAGSLRRDQWLALREAAADARVVLPRLTGEAWLYFARLYALARAVLRHDPDGAEPPPAAG